MKVLFTTFGCKANQYDTQRFRQELEARGHVFAQDSADAEVCVVNTCTVTDNADREAQKHIRRLRRENPEIKIVVAGCSASLYPELYEALPEVAGVVGGHDVMKVAQAVSPDEEPHLEPIGGTLLRRDQRGTRGWMKVQDGV